MPRDGTLPDQPLDPLETLLAQEWQAAQLGQTHVADVMNKVFDAWRKDRAEIMRLKINLAAAQAELATRPQVFEPADQPAD